MPANQTHITSILQTFSTFLATRSIDDRSAESAMLTLVEYLQVHKDFSSWNPEKITEVLNAIPSTNLNARQLVHEFLLAHPPHQTNVYLNDFLLALLHDNCSQSTIRNYRSDIGQFISFAQISTIGDLLQKPNILSFLKNESHKGLKSSSLKRKLISITQFALWAEEHDLISTISPWLAEISDHIDKLLIDQTKSIHTKPNDASFRHWTLPIENHADKLRESIWRNPFAAAKSKDSAQNHQELQAKLKAGLASLTQNLQIKTQAWMLPYLNLSMIVLFFMGAIYFGYLQFFRDAPAPLAYPTSLTRPNRTLSFQGRLTDSAQNPLTTATDFRFRLYDSGPSTTGGTELWDSTTCSVTPDQDGIFAVGLGDDCGSEIGENVFTENSNVWLQVEVETEVLDPRQQIKTVAYALNSETLQGYPASASAVENTVIVMDNNGDIVLGSASPTLRATGDSFAIEADSLTLQTTAGSNGNITLSPDGSGVVNVLSNLYSSGYVAAPGATLSATYSGGTALVTRGGPSGGANIQEWQTNNGTAVTVIDQSGFLDFSNSAAPNTWNNVLKFNNWNVGGSEVTGGFGNGFIKYSVDGRSFLNLVTDSSANSLLSGGINTEAYRRFAMTGSGKWQVGSGSATQDTFLERATNGGWQISTTASNVPTLKSTGYINLATVSTPGSPASGDIYADGTDVFYYDGSNWIDLTVQGGSTYWDLVDNTLFPRNEYASVADILVGGSSTASAQIRLASNGQGYFSGNVGIGSTSPGAKLDISGTLRSNSTVTLSGLAGDASETTGVLINGSNQLVTRELGSFAFISTLAHSSLTGLTAGDDHTQYLYLAGRSGGQTAIGGTGITDVLTLQGTSGNGTLTSPAIQAKVGNNGATTALTILNNGNIGIGTTAPTVPLELVSTQVQGFLSQTTATDATIWGGEINVDLTSTSGYSATGLLVNSDAAHSAGNAANATGLRADAYADNSAYALYGTALSDEGDTFGAWVNAESLGAGGNAYAFYGGAYSNQTAYGLYIYDGINYLSENTGIGTTSPTAYLDIAGSEASRASLRLRSSATPPTTPNDGDIYYDTAKDSLMLYTGSKWQADRSSATLIVAANDSLFKDRADYVADGTADQTEIEAAITALPAGGGVVVLLEGTYSLSDDITIAKSNVKLVGTGTATVLSKAWDQTVAETKGAITLGEDTSTYSGIEIRSLTLLGNKATYTDVDNYGIYIAGKVNESTVADITINDFAGAGIYSKGLGETNTGNVFSKNIIKNGGSYGIYLYYNNRKTLITDNYIYSNGNAGVYLRYDEDDSQIVNNRIESNTGAGIYIYQASSRLTISNNQIITNTSYGITMNSGSDNPLISGNVVSGNGNHGIDLTSVDQADVSGNMVIGNTGRGINVYVSNYANVTGNTVNSNTTNGIRIDTANYANVTGNNLYANTGTGTDSSIYLTSSDNNSISGNRIVDTAGTGYAINIFNSTSDTNYLASNYYTGTGATAINNAGTGTIYGGQTYGSDYVIAPTGNVGIGTTGPASLFSVGATSQFRVDSGGDLVRIKNLAYSWPTAHTTNGILKNDGSGNLTWSTIGAADITADSLNFTEFLDAMSLDATTSVAFGASNYVFNLDSTGDFIIQDAGVDQHIFYDNGDVQLGESNELFVDTSAGSVGIGIPTPSLKLHIYQDTDSPAGILVQNPSPGTSSYAIVRVQNNTSATGQFGIGSSTTAAPYSGRAFISSTSGISLVAASTSDLRLFTNETTERMRIASGGNVGIGSTNPGALLDIGTAGTTLGTLRLAGNTSGYVQIQPSAAAGSWNLTLPTSAGTGGYVLTTNGSGVTSWTDPSVLAVRWNNIADPNGNQTLIMGGYTSAWTYDSLTTGSGLTVSSNSLTSGNLINLTSTSTALSTGGLLNLSATGAPVTTWTGSLAAIEYNSADVDVDGNALRVGLLGTAAGSGTALNVTSAQTGTGAYVLRVNDDGTYSDSTPFLVDVGGNVGIGTLTPGNNLHIYQNVDSGIGITIQNPNNGSSANTEFMAQNDVANQAFFGIGSSNTDSTFASRAYVATNTSGYGISLAAANTSGDIRMFTGGDTSAEERLRVASNGNVGIGTTAPNAMLELGGSGVASASAFTARGASPGYINQLNGNDMVFRTSVGGDVGLIERLRIANNTGYIGINSTTPGYNLDVNGSINATSYYVSGSPMGTVAAGTVVGQTLYWNGTSWAASSNIFNSGFGVGIGTTTMISERLNVNGNVLIGNNNTYKGNNNSSSAISLLGVDGSNNVNLGAINNAGGKVNLYEDGSIAMTIDGTNVGIGATSPGQKLWVEGSGGTSGVRIAINDTDVSGVQWHLMSGGSTYGVGKFNIRDGTTGNNRLTIDTNGNVGISSVSPRGALDVGSSNDVYLAQNTVAGTAQSAYLPGHIFIAPYNSTDVSYLQARRSDSSGSTNLQIRTYNAGVLTNAMYVASNGYVGIGTTPNYPLEVVSSTSDRVSFTNSVGTIQLSSYGAGAMAYSDGSSFYATDKSVNIMSGLNNTGEIRFNLLTGSTWERKMTIANSGNVGIGTPTPSSLFHVYGTETTGTNFIVSNIQGLKTNNGGSSIFRHSSNGYSTDIEQNNGSTGPFRYGTYIDTNIVNNFTAATGPYGNINFVTNNAIVMRISGGNAAGNVGIGTTSTTERLDVNGDVLVRGSGGTIGISNIANAYILAGADGAGLGIDSNEIFTEGSSIHIGSITSHDTILYSSATPRLAILSGGNVGVGTTNPTSPLDLSAAAAHTIPQFAINYAPTTPSCNGCQNIAQKINITDAAGSNKTNIGLWINSTGAATNYSALFQNGNVGIGTTAPAYALDIRGNTYANNLVISGGSTPSNGGILRFEGNQNYAYYAIQRNSTTPIVTSSTAPGSFIDYSRSLAFIESGSSGFGVYGSYDTIKIYNNNAGLQYFYPYNSVTADTPIRYRTADYAGSGWNAWRSIASQEWTDTRISGTTNYVPKYTSANTIGNSSIFDNGTSVGVGTSSPSYRVHVTKSVGDWQALFQNTDTGGSSVYLAHGNGYGMYIGNGSDATSGTYAFRVDTNGIIGWQVSGTGVLTAGNLYNYNNTGSGNRAVYVTSAGVLGYNSSSIRYKKNIIDIDDAEAELLLQLRPVSYQYKQDPDGQTKNWGFIAEETDLVTPWNTFYDEQGLPTGVGYEFFVPGLVKGFQLNYRNIEKLSDLSTAQEASISAIQAVLPNAKLYKEQDLSLSNVGLESGQIYQVTNSGLALDNFFAAAKAIIANIQAGLISTQELVVTKTASITSLSVDSLSVGGQSIRNYIAGVVAEMSLGNQTISLPADSVISNIATENIIATGSAQLANISTNSLQAGNSKLGQLLATDATISGELTAGTLATTNLTSENINTDNATVAETLIANTINTTSARIQALEAGMAQLEAIKAQTAEFTTATISGTLYASSIDQLEEKIEATLRKPTLLESILNSQEQTVPAADVAVVEMLVDYAGYDTQATQSATTQTLADLSSSTPDVELTTARLFVNEYFELNGTGFIAQTLGIGGSLMIGDGMEISSGQIAYSPEGILAPELQIQPSGVGSINFLAGVMTIADNGTVAIKGDLTVEGAIAAAQVKTDTLLTNLIQPIDFGTPFQVQVAGISTSSGEIKKSRFEIINEEGTAVAAFDADGNAEFSGGIKVNDISVTKEDLTVQNLENDTVTTEKTSGKATLTANKDQIIIKANKVQDTSLVYVTPRSSTDNKVLYIKEQKAGEFIVGFDTPLDKDVEFNWWIVN